MKIAESQRISREWRALDGNLMNPPEISDAEQGEVTRMIDFYNCHHKVENNFDVIVTDKSLNDHLGYNILENKVPLTKTGKPKFTKSKAPATSVHSAAQRGTSRTRRPPSHATGVEDVRVAPSTAAAANSRAVFEPEVPLFREAGGVVIEMGIPDSPQATRANSAGGSGADSQRKFQLLRFRGTSLR
jgi:hypothetical protein